MTNAWVPRKVDERAWSHVAVGSKQRGVCRMQCKCT